MSHTKSVQNEYIRNADMTPIRDDIRNAYMNELGEIASGGLEFINIANVLWR